MENNSNLIKFGYILGGAFVLAAIIGSLTFYGIRSADYITTTGSAKMPVTSDKVKWTSTITREVKSSGIREGYARMDTDLKEVRAFLLANGITENQISIAPVFMFEKYEQYQTAEKSYNLTQNIEVNSDKVAEIDALSKNTISLINKGILFSSTSLEFYYSNLPDARVQLLEEAVADAKARAGKLASAGGKRIGALKSASSGVVQVLSPNSVEVSDYGMYNTSTIEKEIMVTVKASFAIR